MAHLVEEYAKSLGVKIGKPFLLEHFYPVKHSKYITIHCDNKIDSKYYEYFPQVINLIKEILHKHGYAIYQTGGESDPKLNVDEHYLNLTYKQSINLIKNSSLHVGIDSLPVHIASVYDIPIVVLYSHIYANHARPYWSSAEKVKIFESEKGNNKPSFSYQESPKTIRTITPESIAQSVLDLLKIDEKLNFCTKFIGDIFHVDITEVVPDFVAELAEKNKILYVRADLHFDEQKIAFWLSHHKCNIITKEKISLDLLRHFSPNINHIYFKNINMDMDYLLEAKKAKINFTICTDEEENLAEIKNKFFEFNVEFDNWKKKVENVPKNDCYFLTNKIILSNTKLYPSEAHFKMGKELDAFNRAIYDDDSFWKEAHHFLFYERTSGSQN